MKNPQSKNDKTKALSIFGLGKPIEGDAKTLLSRLLLARLRQQRDNAQRLHDKALSKITRSSKHFTAPDPYIHYRGCSVTRFPFFTRAEEFSNLAIRIALARYRRRPSQPWRQEIDFLFKLFRDGHSPARLAEILKIWAEMAIQRGNTKELFAELSRDRLTKTAASRADQTPEIAEISWHAVYMIAYWTEHLFWLATDFAVWLYLKHEFKLEHLTEAAVTKTRDRLKLKQHPKLQPISGFSQKTGFIWRNGDLDSYVTGLSI